MLFQKKFYQLSRTSVFLGFIALFIISLSRCECLNNPTSTTNPTTELSHDEQGDLPPSSEDVSLDDNIIVNIKNSLLKDTINALKLGNKKNLQKDNDTTAQILKLAVKESQNNIPILKYLLQYGKIDINTPNSYGHTVLTEAVYSDRYKPEVVQFLLAQHANPNGPAKELHKGPLTTPIYVAIASSNLDGLKLLVEAGADCNIPCDQHGNRPLHIAATTGRLDIVKYLLQKGAKRGLLNNEGELPYQLTTNEAIKQLLMKGY